jgi:hypothetical protein
MSDDAEWAKEVAALFRGLYEDSVIAAAEKSLPLTPDPTCVPMPDTCHPAYASNAEFVRSWRRDDPVRIPRPYRPAYAFADEALYPVAEPLRSLVLTPRKCMGGVPFVGDPRVQDARYVWRAFMDDAGRHIATSAELVWAR